MIAARSLLAFLLAAGLASQVLAAPPQDDYFARRLNELEGELNRNLTSPRAAATLYRMTSLEDDLPSLDRLAAILERVSQSTKASGEVRQLAQYLLSQVEVSEGRLDQCAHDNEQLGFAEKGWLIGGFDNEGGAGHSAVYGPEKSPMDRSATYQGKETEVSWRRVPTVGPEGEIPIADLLRPHRNATFYFETTLEMAAAETVVLHLGTSGATKLWVNSDLVLEDSDDHPARFDQHAIGVGMKRGPNTVLVKISTLDESPALFLRASDVHSAPLKHGRFVEQPTLPASTSNPPAGLIVQAPSEVALPHEAVRVVPYEDVTTQLQKLAEKHPDDASIIEDYAEVLADRRPFDSKMQLHRRQQEKAVALNPKDARAQTRLAHYIDDDQNDRRRAIEAALAADPKFAPARAQLAAYYMEHGFTRRAYDEAAQAAADDPSYFPGQLVFARALSAVGLDARARRLQLSFPDRFPTSPGALLEAARTERGTGHLDKTISIDRQVLQLRHDEHQARSELTSTLLDTGRVAEALALLRDEEVLHPTSVALGLKIADLLSYNGQPAEALKEYNRLAQMAPEDDSIFEARGQHYLRQGLAVMAMPDFKTALSLKPQNARLQELVRSVEPQENFAEPYLRDAVALAKAAHAAPVPPDDEAVVLANVDVVRVFPNGLSSRVHQQVVHVLNDRGVEHNRVEAVQYSPDGQQIHIEHARVIKKDGTVIDAKTETDQELTDSWAGMYFDFRQHIVAFPNVEPGDVIEFSYRRDDISQENMFADYFGDVDYLQGSNPNKDVEYVLIAPAERTLYWNKPALPNVQHTEEKTADGKQVLRWHATEVPKIEPEPRMPGWADVAAYLHVSTFKEWDDVAKFWWGMVHDQLHVTPEVAKAAEEAVAGIPESDVRGRIRAVYDYVVTKTRYVGLEFGIHGFKPYTVDRILARRFGDCKDKASLMYAMLKHLHIDSQLVLLRMRNLGHLAQQPASLAVFNHCILYVPAIHAFLDGTAEFSGSEELPGADQGAQVLVVQNDGHTPSTLTVTPVSSAADNVTSSQITIALAPDGSAKIDGVSHVHGQAAQDYRRSYESETGRREKFEQSYAHNYPGAHATLFDIGDPHTIEKAVETHFALTVPRLARSEQSGLVFSPFGEPWRFAQANAALSKRQYPVELGTPWRNEFRYNVQIPAGYSLAEAPASVHKDSPFGSYEYSIKPGTDGFVVTGHVSFAVDKVPPDQYDAFRAFMEEVDRVFSRQVHLSTATASTAHEAAR